MSNKKYGSDMHRRAAFHDYRRPGNYLFTVCKHPDAPPFIIGF